jgi:hypothetical protein
VVSVIVRSGPFRTAVNGTLVARPPRMTPVTESRRWLHPDCRVRPVLGDHRLVGESTEGSRQPGWGLESAPFWFHVQVVAGNAA